MNYQLLIDQAKASGIDEIEISVNNTQSTDIEVFQGELSKLNIGDVIRVSVRGIYHGKMGYFATENTQIENETIIQAIIDCAANLTSNEPPIIYGGSVEYHTVKPQENEIYACDNSKKIEMLKDLEKTIKSQDSRIDHVGDLSYWQTKQKISILNSKGLCLNDIIEYAGVQASVIAKQEEDIKEKYDLLQISTLNFDKEAFAKKLVKKTVEMLNSGSVKSGSYDIILQTNVASSLLDCLVQMTYATKIRKNLSPLKDKLEKKIINDQITIIEEPLFKEAAIKRSFDDEGVATNKKTILENGVLKIYLHNLSTAKAFNVEPTGNGYKNSNEVEIGHKNVQIIPGINSFDDLITSTENGVLINEIQGLHSGYNGVSGDFSLQASGHFIENGKITRPVSLLVMSGNLITMFDKVTMIANDQEYGFKSSFSPSLKVSKLQIAGQD